MKNHQIRPVGPAEPVPVFNCEVLVGPAPDDSSRVRARVANLAGLTVICESELAALQEIVPMFKRRVTEFVKEDKPIPWLEVKTTAQPQEQTRLIAVHL